MMASRLTSCCSAIFQFSRGEEEPAGTESKGVGGVGGRQGLSEGARERRAVEKKADAKKAAMA